MNLSHSSAIVLGGIGGIGKEICLKFLARGLKSLAIIDIVNEAEIKTLLGTEFKNIKFIYKQCSVTNEQELRKCMGEIKDELELIDIIVNSVGVVDETNWKRTIDINYGGVVNSTIIGIDLMRKDKGMQGGFIVNIASIFGLNATFCVPVYASSKHAILGFTRSLKNDKFYEETGVKFIAICPGVTNTPLLANLDNILGNILFPTMVEEAKSICLGLAVQEADVVGECVMAALDDGENGSTWQCENGRIVKLQMVEYPKF